MRAPLILFGGIIVLSLAVARALSCVCSPLECDILTEEDCPGGLTWDPCKYVFIFLYKLYLCIFLFCDKKYYCIYVYPYVSFDFICVLIEKSERNLLG